MWLRLLLQQVHHRLFVCSNAREQKSNTVANTTVINITPGSERLSATGLKVSQPLQVTRVVWRCFDTYPSLIYVTYCDARLGYAAAAGDTLLAALSHI